MTRKHFEAIAHIILSEQKSYVNEACVIALEDVAIRLAHQFNVDNPRFDKARFMKACGF